MELINYELSAIGQQLLTSFNDKKFKKKNLRMLLTNICSHYGIKIIMPNPKIILIKYLNKIDITKDHIFYLEWSNFYRLTITGTIDTDFYTITNFLSVEDCKILSQVNKHCREMVLHHKKYNMLKTFFNKFKEHENKKSMFTILKNMAKFGNNEIYNYYKFGLNKLTNLDIDFIINISILSNNLEISNCILHNYQFGRIKNSRILTCIIYNYLKNINIDSLLFLCDYYKDHISDDIIKKIFEYYTKNNNLKAIETLITYFEKFELWINKPWYWYNPLTDLIANSLKTGNLELIKFWIKRYKKSNNHQPYMYQFEIEEICKTGSFLEIKEIIELLDEKNICINSDAVKNSLANTDEKVFYYLIDRLIVMKDEYIFDIIHTIINNGKVDFFKYMMDKYPSLINNNSHTFTLISIANKSDNIDILKILINKFKYSYNCEIIELFYKLSKNNDLINISKYLLSIWTTINITHHSTIIKDSKISEIFHELMNNKEKSHIDILNEHEKNISKDSDFDEFTKLKKCFDEEIDYHLRFRGNYSYFNYEPRISFFDGFGVRYRLEQTFARSYRKYENGLNKYYEYLYLNEPYFEILSSLYNISPYTTGEDGDYKLISSWEPLLSTLITNNTSSYPKKNQSDKKYNKLNKLTGFSKLDMKNKNNLVSNKKYKAKFR